MAQVTLRLSFEQTTLVKETLEERLTQLRQEIEATEPGQYRRGLQQRVMRIESALKEFD